MNQKDFCTIRRSDSGAFLPPHVAISAKNYPSSRYISHLLPTVSSFEDMASFHLTIKSPCSEKWESFEKNGNTGFCSSCQKNVIDFTKYSDHDIIEFFNKNNRNACGMFRTDQLKRYSPPKKKRDFSTALAFLTAGILTVSNPTESKATAAITVINNNGINNIYPVRLSTAPSQDKAWTEIKGVVIDEDKAIVAGVNVVIKGTTYGTTTDSEGNFSLSYQSDGETVVLVFSYIGLEPLEKEVKLSAGVVNTGTTMLRWDVVSLGGYECVYPWYSPRRWWSGIRNLFN